MVKFLYILCISSLLLRCSTTSNNEIEESENLKCAQYYDSLSGLKVYNKFTYEPILNQEVNSFLEQFRNEIENNGCIINKTSIEVGFIIDINGNLKYPRILNEISGEQQKMEICLIGALKNIKGWYPGRCDNTIVDCYIEKNIQIHY